MSLPLSSESFWVASVSAASPVSPVAQPRIYWPDDFAGTAAVERPHQPLVWPAMVFVGSVGVFDMHSAAEECADNGIADRTADARDSEDGVVAEDVAAGAVGTLIASVCSTVGLESGAWFLLFVSEHASHKKCVLQYTQQCALNSNDTVIQEKK